jgi:hypothetical protein
MRLRITIALLLVLLGTAIFRPEAARPGQAAGEAEKDKKQATVSSALLERDAKEEQTVQKNGVTFSVRAKLAGKSGQVELHWELKYDGPRSPLVIVKPTLDLPTQGQTRVIFLAAALGRGDAHPYGFFSPTEFEKPPAAGGTVPQLPKVKTSKDWFLTIPKGKSTRGSFTFPLKQLKEYYLRLRPDHFDRERAPHLYVQVYYTPFDRAEEFNLDAWTGDLSPHPLLVPGLTRW